MKFHGRVHPGRLLDLATPLEVRIHQPRKCAGVTIKIWELDAFIGADGKPQREGTPDDLLATFTGSIEAAPPGGRPPEWRKFVVDSAKIEEAPPDAMRFVLKFPGSDAIYEIPVISDQFRFFAGGRTTNQWLLELRPAGCTFSEKQGSSSFSGTSSTR